MTDLIYEHPLNEKIRSFLRLEYLAQQLRQNLEFDHQHRCFYPLFSLLELNERCDYRGDLLKEIDKQLTILIKWKRLPHVDANEIQSYIESLSKARETLQSSSRIGSELKQDRFLTALKQRFGMPGACCNFDLPQLHFWLAKSWDERIQEYTEWAAHFMPLLTPIELLLSLVRSTSDFQHAAAAAGFFQGTNPQALSLIRVKVDPAQGCYPTISGHKSRFAIHFVRFDDQRHSDKTITFQLATCV